MFCNLQILQNMAMAFSVVRRFLIGWRSGCCNPAIGGDRNMSTSVLPWLMLPPAFEGEGFSYYSLAEQKTVSINGELVESESELVGSSHGWLALFNRRNSDLILSNPLSRRQIRLPSIEILRDPQVSVRDGHVSVSKVILSSSPDNDDEQGCRAMMTYAPAIGGSRLAFCSPGRSWRWTPIGEYESVCEELVYCSRMEVLTSITQCEFDFDLELECFKVKEECGIVNWDIGSPVLDDWNMGEPQVEDWDVARPPKEVWEVQEDVVRSRRTKRWVYVNEQGRNTWRWVVDNIMPLLKQQCIQIPHLVYDDDDHQLFLVMRFVLSSQTVGFVVLRVNGYGDGDGGFEVVDDLNGLAMFVGMNHSFAISASHFPQLKPNSIYFTDANRRRMLHGVDDTGVFDYENKIISPVIATPHDHPFKSSPMWFYPLPEQGNAMCNK